MHGIHVGQTERVTRVFSQSDFDRFAALSGDDNPIHVDPVFSARTKFGRTVAHGMFLYGVVCSVLGTRLPGAGTLQLEQELIFPNPAYVGDEVEIQLAVTEVDSVENLADLTTVLLRSDGKASLQGRTRVRLPGFAQPNPQSTAPPRRQTEQTEMTSFKGLEIGQRAQTHRALNAQELAEYADLTGDENPIFTDVNYAHMAGLQRPVIPGALLGGLFSYLLGTKLPGPGTNYLKQRLEFLQPAYQDQELTASVEIIRIRPEKQLVNLSTVCADPLGDHVCRGEALVLVSDVAQ